MTHMKRTFVNIDDFGLVQSKVRRKSKKWNVKQVQKNYENCLRKLLVQSSSLLQQQQRGCIGTIYRKKYCKSEKCCKPSKHTLNCCCSSRRVKAGSSLTADAHNGNKLVAASFNSFRNFGSEKYNETEAAELSDTSTLVELTQSFRNLTYCLLDQRGEQEFIDSSKHTQPNENKILNYLHPQNETLNELINLLEETIKKLNIYIGQNSIKSEYKLKRPKLIRRFMRHKRPSKKKEWDNTISKRQESNGLGSTRTKSILTPPVSRCIPFWHLKKNKKKILYRDECSSTTDLCAKQKISFTKCTSTTEITSTNMSPVMSDNSTETEIVLFPPLMQNNRQETVSFAPNTNVTHIIQEALMSSESDERYGGGMRCENKSSLRSLDSILHKTPDEDFFSEQMDMTDSETEESCSMIFNENSGGKQLPYFKNTDLFRQSYESPYVQLKKFILPKKTKSRTQPLEESLGDDTSSMTETSSYSLRSVTVTADKSVSTSDLAHSCDITLTNYPLSYSSLRKPTKALLKQKKKLSKVTFTKPDIIYISEDYDQYRIGAGIFSDEIILQGENEDVLPNKAEHKDKSLKYFNNLECSSNCKFYSELKHNQVTNFRKNIKNSSKDFDISHIQSETKMRSHRGNISQCYPTGWIK